MSHRCTSVDTDSSRVHRYPDKRRGMGWMNAELSGMSPPASRSMTSTVLGRALLLAMAGLAGCGGNDNAADAVVAEKAPACIPSPGDAVHVELVCLRVTDLFIPDKIKQAKEAYDRNAAIVLEGGTLRQLRTVLGVSDIAATEETAAPEPAAPEPAQGEIADRSTMPKKLTFEEYMALAGISFRTDGSLNEFEYQADPNLALVSDSTSAEAALNEWWPTKRRNRPSTAGDGWSQQLSRTHSVSSAAGNLTSVVSTYRLNGKDKLFDYFMIANTLVGSANYSVCSAPFTGSGAIGHTTYVRETYMYNAASSPLPTTNITVFESQPGTSVGSNSEGWSIGGNLGFNASGPTGGISASYSQSYSYPNITTERVGRDGTRLVGWKYNFNVRAGFFPKVCPPSENYNSLSLPNAVIVQVPKGRSWTAWVFNRNNFMYETFKMSLGFVGNWNPNTSNISTSETYQLIQPSFGVDRTIVAVPGNNGTSSFNITASNVGSQFGLSWEIVGIPQWMVVDRTSGTGNQTITVRAQPGTLPGSTAFLNINTLPANAANSVENGPIVVQVVAQ